MLNAVLVVWTLKVFRSGPELRHASPATLCSETGSSDEEEEQEQYR